MLEAAATSQTALDGPLQEVTESCTSFDMEKKERTNETGCQSHFVCWSGRKGVVGGRVQEHCTHYVGLQMCKLCPVEESGGFGADAQVPHAETVQPGLARVLHFELRWS